MVYVNDLLKEIRQMQPIDITDEEYFSNAENPVWRIVQDIIDRLPNVYDADFEKTEIATNGDEILFKFEVDCENFADALDEHIFGDRATHTGYYDPYEDYKNNMTDENTGWYYINFD